MDALKILAFVMGAAVLIGSIIILIGTMYLSSLVIKPEPQPETIFKERIAYTVYPKDYDPDSTEAQNNFWEMVHNQTLLKAN